VSVFFSRRATGFFGLVEILLNAYSRVGAIQLEVESFTIFIFLHSSYLEISISCALSSTRELFIYPNPVKIP
jgi:hypothetical protein